MSYRPHPTRSGWYYVEHRPNGRKGKLERNVVEGIEAAIALDNAFKARKHQPSDELHPTFNAVVDQYLQWAEQNRSPKTVAEKRRRLTRYVLPYFGEYRIRDLNQTVIDGYEAQHTKSIFHNDMAHLMALVRWMQKRKLGPMLDFKPEFTQPPAKVKVIPCADDIMAVLAAIPSEQARTIYTLTLLAGLRWSEATMLKWENVDLKTRSIKVAEVEHGEVDIIPIPNMLYNWFETNYKAAGWVFQGRKKGTHVGRLQGQLRKAVQATGVKMNPHLFRHASATYLYDETEDIYAVNRHLRHKKLSTSMIYTRFSIAKKRQSVSTIEHVFNNINKNNTDNSNI